MKTYSNLLRNEAIALRSEPHPSRILESEHPSKKPKRVSERSLSKKLQSSSSSSSQVLNDRHTAADVLEKHANHMDFTYKLSLTAFVDSIIEECRMNKNNMPDEIAVAIGEKIRSLSDALLFKRANLLVAVERKVTRPWLAVDDDIYHLMQEVNYMLDVICQLKSERLVLVTSFGLSIELEWEADAEEEFQHIVDEIMDEHATKVEKKERIETKILSLIKELQESRRKEKTDTTSQWLQKSFKLSMTIDNLQKFHSHIYGAPSPPPPPPPLPLPASPDSATPESVQPQIDVSLDE